jgi:predicted GH43/DUF377 family glycosyl hydrolase
MRWRKMGLIYTPDGTQTWAKSHAMLPTPLDMGDGRLRIYVAFVDANTVGRIGYVDVDAHDPARVLAVSKQPVLDIGEPGAFDDNGVNPSSIVRAGDEIRLYYIGYQLGIHVRYLLFAGLAISRDGGATFERHARVPLLERSDGEMLLRSAPNVAADGDAWRMWYVAGDRHIPAGGTTRPTYNVRYIESADGIHWPAEGEVAVDLAGGDEYGLGRPFVSEWGGVQRMFYSVRSHGRGYHLGYAEAADGRNWLRRDQEVGIEVSRTGWDSEMLVWASVCRTEHGTYLFYNGNGYGESGFGYAILE